MLSLFHLHVGKDAHDKSREGRDGSRGSHSITTNILNAEHVGIIIVAGGIVLSGFADTGTSRVGDNGGIDSDDIRHGEEGGQTCANLCEEVGALALTPL